jgi:DNA-binding beta-propeller fold protein YncE
VTIDTIGSSFDTVLSVYQGSSVSNLVEVATDNESGGGGSSKLDFFVAAGAQYRIAIDRTYFGYAGQIVLNLRYTPGRVPTIYYPPASQTVLVGNEAYLEAGARGTIPLWYQWQKSGANVAGATDAYYYIANVQTNLAGSYALVVTNAAGSVTSSPAILTAVTPPTNDMFSNRFAIVGWTNRVNGHNFGATAEPGEPYHSGIPASQSVWWTWTAPSNGVVTLDTIGSSFRTVLAAYIGNSISNLTAVASDIGSGGHGASKCDFFVGAGTVFQIAVDTYYPGISGWIALNLGYTPARPPSITRQPRPESLLVGEGAYFYISAEGTAPLKYQWRREGGNLFGATDIDYFLSNAQTNQAGLYTVVVTNAAGSVTSTPALLTVFTPPPNDMFSNRMSIVGLTNNTTGQNFGATKEPGEPDHAGNPGGDSVWWAWTAPTNGTVTIDTIGSSFNTLLAVYTGSSLSNLTLHASDDQSGGNNTSQLSFPGVAGTVYQIAVDGSYGARGNILLHVRQVGSGAPILTTEPTSRAVPMGGGTTFNVSAVGIGPLRFQWLFNGGNLPGATAASLQLSSLGFADAGAYAVMVTNAFSSILSSNAILTVTPPVSSLTNPPTFIYKVGLEPSTPGQFKDPRGVALDAAGNLYVADTFNYRIQKFSTNGTFITQWGSLGTNTGQFDAPTGIAVSSNGQMYVADSRNNRIQKFTSSGVPITMWGVFGPGPGQFNDPRFLALDSSGNVYVADSQNDRIQKFDKDGVFLTQWGTHGTNAGQFDEPRGVAVSHSGQVYVSDFYNHRIQKFTTSGTFLAQWGTFGALPGQFEYPYGIATDVGDNVYVSSYDDRIQSFDSNGAFRNEWGGTGNDDGQFNSPIGLAADTGNKLFVADFGNSRIQEFTTDGNFVSKLGNQNLPGLFNFPSSLALDASGEVYVADGYNRIQKFSRFGGYLAQWGNYGSQAGQFVYPSGIATSLSKQVFVADSGNNRIEKFAADGAYLGQWGIEGADPGQFEYPVGLATDASGNIYVADANNYRIQKFSSSGKYLLEWGGYGTNPGEFAYPGDVATDSSGNVYVADADNSRIQKFDSNGNFLTEWGSYGTNAGEFYEPFGLAVDVSDDVYVADSGNHRIQKFDSNGGFLTQWGSQGTNAGQFSFPEDVAVDSSGNYVYVADTENNRIQAFGYALGPFITSQPQSQLATLGSTVTFSVVASSPAPLAYQWQHNGANIPGASSPTLVLPNVQLPHAGNYQVIVNNNYGSIMSAIATLSISSAPVFQSITRAGGAVNFSWSSVSGRTYQVQYKTNINQASWSALGASVSATNSTMTASDTIGQNARRFYRVVLLP